MSDLAGLNAQPERRTGAPVAAGHDQAPERQPEVPDRLVPYCPVASPDGPGADEFASGTRRLLVNAGVLLLLASCVSLTKVTLFADGMDGEQGLPSSLVDCVQSSAALIGVLWLALLVCSRTSLGDSPGARRPRLRHRLAVSAGVLVVVYATTPAAGALGQQAGRAVYACVLAWLAVEVCRGHGLPLRAGFLVADARQRRQTWHITSQAFLWCLAGTLATTLVARVLLASGIDGMPDRDQRSLLGLDSAASVLTAVITTIAIEDIVILAAATTLFTAAQRPAWQLYTVIGLLEVVLHGYEGIPAIGVFVYAAGRIRLYRRYGYVVPLVISHAAYDLIVVPISWLPKPYPLVLFPLVAVAVWFDGRLKKRAVAEACRGQIAETCARGSVNV
ncbi:hypothetical protein [Streptomyces scabiei]|uniref:hypothetical protein n=1 Tax=Streptomyces scabiei TaxID=1930 RepID=UPI0029B7A672|nr:hypothetical protein [Streptomyces scabiei]MDX3523351.1 hypothetical protein [Streptomyces scabiei]